MSGGEVHDKIASDGWRRHDDHTPSKPKLRVGFIWETAPDDVLAVSGMPWAMAASLQEAGAELVPLYVPPKRRLMSLIGRGARRRAPAAISHNFQGALKRAVRPIEFACPQLVHQRIVNYSLRQSRQIDALLRTVNVDVVFGCCVSSSLCALQTDRPIVHYSDVTAKLINDAYPAYARRGKGFKQARNEIEHATLSRTAIAVYASPWAQRSAIEDYAMAPNQTRVVPMGSHISPADLSAESMTRPSKPPSKDDLRLVMIAADPIRKRLDLAVDTAERLNAMGWRATLTLIGTPTKRATASPVCQTIGSLSLADPDDRATIAAALSQSHLLLLPSIAEGFGIAPCEAAQFGVPSIVSDAGGLPHAVLHRKTGIVLPVNAVAGAYADAIAGLVSSPEQYKAMQNHAQRRAQTELTWSRWAQQMLTIFEQAMQQNSNSDSPDVAPTVHIPCDGQYDHRAVSASSRAS